MEKFSFGEDFGTDRRGAGTAGFRRAADLEKLRLATEEAYRQGHRDGRLEAEGEASMRLAQAMESVATAASTLLTRLDEHTRRFEREAAELAMVFAHKLAGDLVAHHPVALLEAAAGECFRELTGVAHIAVRVPVQHVDPAKAMLDRLAEERGFSGRLVVLGEDGMREGDFHVNWADGGIVRDQGAVEALIDAAMARHCDINH